MSDYISREAAFEVLERIKKFMKSPNPDYETMMMWEIEDFIDTLPAADVVPVVMGEWLIVDESYWRGTQSQDKQINRVSLKCSNCGHRITRKDFRGIRNFCPNCGADMRERRE